MEDVGSNKNHIRGNGAEVTYNDATKQVLIAKDDTEILLTIGSQEAYVNGEKIMLDVPAMIIEGRTMVPLRFISESMNATVEWTEKLR